MTVIDGRKRAAIATIPTGTGPEGIAVNPVTNRVYVANSTESSVTVIDGAADAVIATVKAGSYCQSLAINPTTNRIYVANNSGHSVTVIDGATHRPHRPRRPGSARRRREPGVEPDLHGELRESGDLGDRRRNECRANDPHGQAPLGARGRQLARTASTW